MNEWLLFNTQWAIFQLHLDKNKLHFDETTMMSALYETNMLTWLFIELAYWKNSPLVDMSLHLGLILSWFRGNQSLLLLLNAACVAEKLQRDQGSNSPWIEHAYHCTSDAVPLILREIQVCNIIISPYYKYYTWVKWF